MPVTNRKFARLLVRLLIPIGFFLFVFLVIHPSDIVNVFYAADWGWFGVGCACMGLCNYLCSLRTRGLLFENSQPLIIFWHIHALRALITGALPFSTGELSYVYYLKKYCITPLTEGLAILVSVRFLEFAIFLCLLFLLALCGVMMDASSLNQIALGIITLNLGLVYLAVWHTETLMRPLTILMNVFSGISGKKEFLKKVSQKAEHFSRAVKEIFRSENKHKLFGLTFSIVVLRNVFVLSMIRAMGVHISVGFIVFLFIFLFVTRFIQGFGSFGNQVVGISGALILMGVQKEDALAIAIGAHLLQWAPVLILGVVSYFGIRRST